MGALVFDSEIERYRFLSRITSMHDPTVEPGTYYRLTHKPKVLVHPTKFGSKEPSPHGTVRRYKHHGCKCPPCTAANTEAQRKYRANRKAKHESVV